MTWYTWAILAGALVGSVIGPLTVDPYREYTPRELLMMSITGASVGVIISSAVCSAIMAFQVFPE